MNTLTKFLAPAIGAAMAMGVAAPAAAQDYDRYKDRYESRYGDRYDNRYGDRYDNRYDDRYDNRYDRRYQADPRAFEAEIRQIEHMVERAIYQGRVSQRTAYWLENRVLGTRRQLGYLSRRGLYDAEARTMENQIAILRRDVQSRIGHGRDRHYGDRYDRRRYR